MNNTTSTEMLKRFEEITTEMLEVAKKKNNDYSWELAFWNFDLVSVVRKWRTTAEEWFIVRLCDKIWRIANLIDWEAKVTSESISDSLLDMANYCLLMKIYIETKDSSQ